MSLRRITVAVATTATLLVGGMGAAQAAETSPTIHLRGGGEPGAAGGASWVFGTAGDQHLLCDWNGDGSATAGLYRPSNGTWYLRDAAGGGNAEATFRYGSAGGGDRVLCGDWDGNGTQTPGIYRAGDNTWYLRNSTTSGVADVSFRYGSQGKGDTPLVGDWDADGTDPPGIHRGSDSSWHLRNVLAGGTADVAYRYGSASLGAPVAGDWDGDGSDTPGLYRDANRTWYLVNAHGQANADWSFAWGTANSRPMSGDWDLDGRDEPALSTSPAPSGPAPVSAADQLIARMRVAPEGPRTGYDRALFPHWTTTSGCTTRERVLIAESTVPPTTSSDCSVTGSWYSAYDKSTTTTASTFDIDHMVPLAEAWDSGARTWTTDQRRAFANDLGYAGSLIAVSASSNRSKGDNDAGQWRPTNTAFSCTYATDWVTVKIRWNLHADTAERDGLRSMLGTCPGGQPRPSGR